MRHFITYLFALCMQLSTHTTSITQPCPSIIDNHSQLNSILNHIAHIPLAKLPTPLEPLNNLSQTLGHTLYIKRDDLSGVCNMQGLRMYGGNKVRKLEFLLADALNQNKKEIITFGCIGSNHVAATATHCAQQGLTCHAYVLPQPINERVIQTLAHTIKQGAQIHYFDNRPERDLAAQKHAEKPFTYIIPTGGSNPLGCLGYINATLELYEQMVKDNLTFDAIYLPGGSFGTAVGLWIGLSALGIDIRLKVTYVNDKPFDQAQQDLVELAQKTITFLQQYDAHFDPQLDLNQIELVEGYCGSEYGAQTDAARTAAWIVHNAESIELDHTYSAKCMAHLLDDITNNTIEPKSKILFWNTYYPYSCHPAD